MSRATWGETAVDLTLAAAGTLLAWGVLAQVPREVVAVHALAWYTVVAVAATVVLAAARAATRRLPTLRRTRLDGAEAWRVRAWPGDWWHATFLDLGLVVLAGALTGLAVRAGGDWLVPGLLVAAGGAWFLVRVLLTVTGRRRNEAVWVTADAVVHDSAAGRARRPRAEVVDVRATGRGSWLVLVLLDGPSVVVDCSRMGPDAEVLAGWLRGELDTA